MRKSIFLIIIIFLQLLALTGFSQSFTNAKKWKYAVTSSPKIPDSILFNLYQYRNYLPKENIMCLYFTLQSFQVNNDLYIYFEYDSLFSNANKSIDEGILARQKGCFKVDFNKHVLVSNKIFQLQNELNYLQDTILNKQHYYTYAYKDLTLVSKDTISSVEDNFLTGNCTYISIKKGIARYDIKLIDTTSSIEYSKLVAPFGNSDKPVSEEKKSILDFIVFKIN